MKTTNKLMTVLLVLALTLSLAVPIFATDGNQNNGTITITNAVPGQTYSVYRIFNLDSYNPDEKAYLYTVNSDWSNFIKQDSISGEGKYVVVDATTGLVTWKKMKSENNPDGMAEFAKLALAYAKDESHPITPSATQTAGDAAAGNTTTTVTFTGLPLGYYLVDSSLGALCALNTTSPDASMTEKNGEPTVDKKVLEGGVYDDEASAQIGETVNFKTTITVKAGAENYVLHDKMSEGLAFKGDSVKVYLSSNVDSAPIEADGNYSVLTSDLEDSDPCTFHVKFTEGFCNGLKAEDTIVVTYEATLTKDAAVGNADANTDKNPNETYLTYGDTVRTETSKVDVYTYRFQLVKTDKGKDGIYNVLSGAEFELYNEVTGGDPIAFVQDGVNYRVATDTENNKTTVIKAGTPIIKGLDKKEYWLEETKAPDGFNKLTSRIKVELMGDNLTAANELNETTHTYTPAANPGGVQVVNNAGSMLPSTGGIGTTIFYVLGGILVIGAGILLAIRLRRPNEEK